MSNCYICSLATVAAAAAAAVAAAAAHDIWCEVCVAAKTDNKKNIHININKTK